MLGIDKTIAVFESCEMEWSCLNCPLDTEEKQPGTPVTVNGTRAERVFCRDKLRESVLYWLNWARDNGGEHDGEK